MTIAEESSRMIFDGNGATTEFDFTRPFYDSDELVVSVHDETTGEIVTLAPTAYDVSVTGTFPNNSATITYPLAGPALTTDEQLIIYRASPQEQSTALSSQSAYFLTSLETRLDRNMLMTQELQDQAHRALKVPISTPVDEDIVIAAPVSEGVLVWSTDPPYTLEAIPMDDFIIDVAGVQELIDATIADSYDTPEFTAAWEAEWATYTAGTVPMDSILFAETPAGASGERVVRWNPNDGTLDIGLAGGNVTLQTGQETLIRVANQTGSLITDGTPVVYIGANPARLRVAPAISDRTYAAHTFLGLATEDIAHGDEGFVTVRGAIRGINTSGGPVGETWLDGDELYVSATVAGQLTNVAPSAPNLVVPIAMVLVASAGNGQLFVTPPHVKSLVDLSDVNGTPLTESGLIPVWDSSAEYFDFTRNVFDYDQAYNAVVVSGDCTGFSDPDNVAMTYDSTTRTITITSLGTGSVYFNGAEISMPLPWTSAAHTAATGRYFLQHDGTDFLWASSANFKNIMIAWVNYGATDRFALRECHGLMDWESHRNLHNNIGAYRSSGGMLSSYILNDTANRQPLVSAAVVYDEDLPTTLAAITTTTDYTQAYLTGAGSATTFATVQASIVPVSGNQPYWNEYTGGAWTQTLMTAGYMSVWFIGIPVTGDATSQRYRYVWIQGQSISADTADGLAAQDALTFGSLELGDLATLITEFVSIAKVIIRYTSGNWSIAKVTSLSGSRNIQSTFPVLDWLLISSINDTPVDGVTDAPISSNWAYDHAALTNAHGAVTDASPSTIALRTVDSDLISRFFFESQGATTEITTTSTLTAANLATKIIRLNSASPITVTLPTVANTFSLFNTLAIDSCFHIIFINQNTGTVTINRSDWNTIDAANITVLNYTTTILRFRRSGASSGVVYEVSFSGWNSRNDGTLSGLDADLLDGQHGSYYATDSLVAHLAGTETITGQKTYSATNTYFQNYLNVGKNGGGDSIAYFYDDTNNVYRSLRWNDTVHDWQVTDSGGTLRTLWHAGNDGASSTLDADLLDGQHGSYYATDSLAAHLAGAETFTGAKTFNSVVNISYGGITLNLGADNIASTRTDATAKYSRITQYHYTNTEEPIGLIASDATATSNIVSFGGGSSLVNAATDLRFYTAATTTTSNGTLQLKITSKGLHKIQGTPTAKTASTTLTGAEWATKIITANGAAGAITLQLPTAADMDTYFDAVTTGYCAEEVSVINISTTNNYTATITTNTGWTLVGDMVIIENDTAGNRSSGKFLARKTGTAAWTLYRTT